VAQEDRLKALAERTRYSPAEVEPRVFRRWEDAGIFSPAPPGEAGEPFSIAIPPPNVTGALHMGHALNGAIQDALIRMRRMQGRRTKWIFGTDHAGIGTQVKVEQALREEGTSREQIGREAFIERVWQWRERYGSTIIEQYKRLGASADYADERFTMDPAYAHAVAHVFVRLFERGHIYRDNYMVNWDPGMASAISDLEVVAREVEDRLYMIEYPLAAGAGSVTVATVRPETMLADTAIAVSPGDQRYSRLVGEEATLPLVGRRLPIIADHYVDPEFGTGALKITPGHDPNDFEIGRRHGLDEVSVIGEDGRMTAAAGERFAGLPVAEAREAVVAALREEALISEERRYVHEVPHSHRSGMPIEPLISLQWFCDMRRARTRACTSTGSRRFARGACRASSGGDTSCLCGTATTARRPTSPSGPPSAAAPVGARFGATRTCSTPGSPRRSGRSRRSAGPSAPRRSRRSIRRRCSRPLATSSSSGSLGW
jgi:valyl-tRNA synthetase